MCYTGHCHYETFSYRTMDCGCKKPQGEPCPHDIPEPTVQDLAKCRGCGCNGCREVPDNCGACGDPFSCKPEKDRPQCFEARGEVNELPEV